MTGFFDLLAEYNNDNQSDYPDYIPEDTNEETDFNASLNLLQESLVNLILTSKDRIFKCHALARLDANENNLENVITTILNKFKQTEKKIGKTDPDFDSLKTIETLVTDEEDQFNGLLDIEERPKSSDHEELDDSICFGQLVRGEDQHFEMFDADLFDDQTDNDDFDSLE